MCKQASTLGCDAVVILCTSSFLHCCSFCALVLVMLLKLELRFREKKGLFPVLVSAQWVSSDKNQMSGRFFAHLSCRIKIDEDILWVFQENSPDLPIYLVYLYFWTQERPWFQLLLSKLGCALNMHCLSRHTCAWHATCCGKEAGTRDQSYFPSPPHPRTSGIYTPSLYPSLLFI